MNNILYAIVPLALFAFVLAALMRPRFSRTLSHLLWGAACAAVVGAHLGVGLASFDNAALLTLMPVTAYLPLIVFYFVVSRHNLVDVAFCILLAVIAATIVDLAKKLYTLPVYMAFADNAMAGHAVNVLLTLAIAAAIGAAIFLLLHRGYSRDSVLDRNNWYVDVALFFITGLSLYVSDMVDNLPLILLMLFADSSVFAVIVGYIGVKFRSKALRLEREDVERQIERERAEYRRMEQDIELGRRYRHDMRHHFAVIRMLVGEGKTDDAEHYIESLGAGLSSLGDKSFCRNAVVNAVLAIAVDHAEQLGVRVDVAVDLPPELPFDNADVCAVLSNLLDNAVNGCEGVPEGERRVRLSARQKGGEELEIVVTNTVVGTVPLDGHGMPLSHRSEEHGHGVPSVRYIAEKYHGTLSYTSLEGEITASAVLYGGPRVKAEGGERTRRVMRPRTLVVLPLALVALFFSLNFFPNTLAAIEGIPGLGSAVAIVDVRKWGAAWGDSGIDADVPVTNDPALDFSVAESVHEFTGLFLDYLGKRYNGYAHADIGYTQLFNDDVRFTVSMHCTVNAGSSLVVHRFYTLDKHSGKVVTLEGLFREGEDYNALLSAEIVRQIEERVEQGENYYGFGIFASDPGFERLNDPNFYVDDGGCLVIVFDEQEIAPGNTGTPTFVIPRGVTDPIADEQGLLGRLPV